MENIQGSSGNGMSFYHKRKLVKELCASTKRNTTQPQQKWYKKYKKSK